MAYDGKALASARQIIAERKLNNEAELARRREQAISCAPELLVLEQELTSLMTNVALVALKKGEDAGTAVANAKTRSEAIYARRAELLHQNGFPENYIDEIFSCPDCRDTGYIAGYACRCLNAVYKEEITKQLSSLLSLGDTGFDRFDLSLYEADGSGETTGTIQSVMLGIANNCRDYANNFGKDSVNLLFRGGTGLGKTFLSACIARTVSDKGFSVVYDTTVAVMAAFEAQKFDRETDSGEDAMSQVRRYLSCDLLILDDLGTEMTTAFTQSALYTLINTRLRNGGKTIISTNLSDEDLSRRYTPQIVSRIKCEYLILQFLGRDIRAVKKERGM